MTDKEPSLDAVAAIKAQMAYMYEQTMESFLQRYKARGYTEEQAMQAYQDIAGIPTHHPLTLGDEE